MRTISFVERLEFECQGNVVSKALTVGDVDNDKGYELVVGNVHGDLFIHKGTDTKPWRKASDLGMITCLEVGDVCNHGIKYLVVSTLEGWCHVFAVKPDPPMTGSSQGVPQENNVDNSTDGRLLQPAFRQRLPANSKVLLIADIDGDGHVELVIGYSDRRVRSFRWLDAGADSATGNLQGTFIALETWMLAGQIGSMTTNKQQDGSFDLMVSQPGGTFVTLLDRQSTAKGIGSDGSGRCVQQPSTTYQTPAHLEQLEALSTKKSDDIKGPSLVYHPLGTTRARNPNVTTEVVGNISRRKKDEEKYVPSYCAICTLDGTLTLVDEDKIMLSLYVDHQLFALTKLDITGDGTEEVLACSWDGRTYIVNLSREVVRFHFGEHVAAFCAGYYNMPGLGNVPCLIYVTFNNRVIVYHNINMPQVGITNLVETLQEKPNIQELYNYFNVDASKPEQVRQLFHWCLYGKGSKNS